jgi:hypothetical protein
MFRSHLDAQHLGSSETVNAGAVSETHMGPGMSPHGLVPALPPGLPTLPQFILIAGVAVGVFLLLKTLMSKAHQPEDKE